VQALSPRFPEQPRVAPGSFLTPLLLTKSERLARADGEGLERGWHLTLATRVARDVRRSV